ncbi:myrosinase 1-like [Diorhabda carinulata]|uniref:myrosinase 1-like n=1 Tax=Diorhabda carinulata TaxID=1163345 RepID=UPI0025A256F0|nr:myrosinase 1-like [Diorhabda carinulata]
MYTYRKIMKILLGTACVLCLLFRARADGIGKYKFTEDFLFGIASSAYQIEGGYKENGKGENIYDHYTKTDHKKFYNGSNGNIACDSFRKWRTDVKLLKELGVHFYRFSISWSRILPSGYANNINGDGLRYYNDLINELIEHDIQPMVTMYYNDLPMTLQQLGGWTNPYMAYYFEDYARILFSYFGDRVKLWITMDTSQKGYGDDNYPPYLNQPGIANYLCQHVMLLAHAKAYHLYDDEFRTIQKGKVGIAINSTWYEPGSFSPEDIAAAETAREFKIGSLMNPIFHTDGNYPKIVSERVDNVSKSEGYLQSRMPSLLPQEADYIQGTYDFAGLNIYTTYLVKQGYTGNNITSLNKDANVTFYQDPEWTKTNSDWLRVVPEGARKVLKWVKDKYDDPEIFITENGFPDTGEINDVKRIQYLQKYLKAILESIHEDEVNIKGYTVWSFMDSFEWTAGYSEKFGLYSVDFSDPDRKRKPKKSASWYKKVIKERRVVDLKEVTSSLKG